MTTQLRSLRTRWTTFWAKIVRRKFVQDVGVLTTAGFFSAALSFVQGIMVARWLGPELYGVAALAMSYPDLIYTCFDTRSSEASVKYLSQFHSRGEPYRVLAVCKIGYAIDFTIALLAFLVVLLTARWAAEKVAQRPEISSLIVLYSAAFVARALVSTSYAVLVTLGRFPLIACIDTITAMMRVVLILGLVLFQWNVAGLICGNALATMLTGLLYGASVYPIIRRTWGTSWLRGDSRALRGYWREILAFLAYSDLNMLLGLIPKQLDVVLLGYFRRPTEVGYYKLAKSLAGTVGYLVGPLQSVVYPELTRLYGRGAHQALSEKVRRLALQVGVPVGSVVLACTLLMPLVFSLAVGNVYLPAVPAAQLLIAGAAVWVTFFWVRPLYLTRGKIRTWTGCSTAVVCLSLAGFFVIIPAWGYVGLAVWLMIIQVFSNALTLMYLKCGKSSDRNCIREH